MPEVASADKALAPVLGALKNGRASASSARGLLLTLLGEFALTNDGQAWTQTLVESLRALGIEEKAARQAIARLSDRGWLQSHRHGRRTRWSLTPEITALLQDGATRIYGFGNEPRDWDGRWLLVTATVPERNRKVRYQLASGLSWAGFGSLGHGWWVSPRPDREVEAKQVLAEAGISDSTSFIAMHSTMGSMSDLANRAWDLDTVRSSYKSFMTQCNELEATYEKNVALTSVTCLVQLVHEWRRFPFLDPDLPPDLLPSDWPGPSAAARFRELRSLWHQPATMWWQSNEAKLSS